MFTRSPSGERTKEVSMPMIFSSSSAAWAAMTPAHRVVRHRYGDVVPVQSGVLDDGIFGDGARQIILIQFFHIGGIRPGAAEESRRLKSTAAGAHCEVFGVQHDAGQQGLRLVRSRWLGSIIYCSSSVTISEAEDA